MIDCGIYALTSTLTPYATAKLNVRTLLCVRLV
ncbi:hypothetical protein VP199E371_P0037 [Vibrio phage 199E37-1]|nr:hypothetical protein VP199E371_P0037 [Vibrio phage 199E37-1]